MTKFHIWMPKLEQKNQKIFFSQLTGQLTLGLVIGEGGRSILQVTLVPEN